MIIPHMLSVVLGSTLRTGNEGTILRVAELIRHPNYNSIYNADIALLRLQRKLIFDDFIRPVCLSRPEQHISRDSICNIAGWGDVLPYALRENIE